MRWFSTSEAARWRHSRWMVPSLLLALAAGGCATYEAQPLRPAEVLSELSERRAHRGVESAALSREDARAAALLFNPALRTARLRAQVPVLSATKAGLWDDPTLSFDVMRIIKSVEEPWIIGTSLAFTLPLSGRLNAEKTKASAEGCAALVGAWAAEQELLRDLDVAWAEAAAARDALETVRLSSRELSEVVGLTARRAEAGELIAAEALPFSVAGARSQLAANESAARLAEAEAHLRALMGFVPDAPVVFDPAPVNESAPPPLTREDLLARHPLIAVRDAEYAAAEQSLRLEIRRQYPDLNLGPAFGIEDGTTRAGLGFSLPLPFLNANKRAIAEADAERSAARGAWEEAVHSALAEDAAVRAKLAAATQQREDLAARVLPQSQAHLVAAKRLAEAGEPNALLLLEALQTQLEVDLQRIEVDAEIARLKAALRAMAPEPMPAVTKGKSR